MMKLIFWILCLGFLFSCGNDEKYDVQNPINTNDKDDSELIVNGAFPKGDVRRYGINANEIISNDKLNAILEFSSGGPQLFFPKGYYPISLNIVGLTNISIYFEDVTLGGGLSIVEKENNQSSKVAIKGDLRILDKIFIRESNNISFQNVTVATDTLKNIFKNKNRGVSIYSGSQYLKFDKLKISDTGGDSLKHYMYVGAALQIHGWNNNPKFITINQLTIQNAGRTALYLTGEHHILKKVIINNFGLGSPANLFGMEDSKKGDEKEFTGVWINKCNNCLIDSLSIKNSLLKGDYSIKFGLGNYSKPTFINNVEFLEQAKNMPLKDDPLTNILVKKTF